MLVFKSIGYGIILVNRLCVLRKLRCKDVVKTLDERFDLLFYWYASIVVNWAWLAPSNPRFLTGFVAFFRLLLRDSRSGGLGGLELIILPFGHVLAIRKPNVCVPDEKKQLRTARRACPARHREHQGLIHALCGVVFCGEGVNFRENQINELIRYRKCPFLRKTMG